MEERFEAAAACLYQILRDLIELRRGVVGNDVHDHPDAVLMRRVAHGFEFVARAELIVADFEIGGLVVIIPLAVAVQLHAAVLALETVVDRRGLHRGKACRGDVGHALLDRVEVPAERLQNGALRHLLHAGQGTGSAVGGGDGLFSRGL